MKVKNKTKAIRLCNEFLTDLDSAYSKEDKAYLYIWSWVYIGGVNSILEALIKPRSNGYNQRVDWEERVRTTDGYIHCINIDESVKEDALRIITPFFSKWEEIKKCFE